MLLNVSPQECLLPLEQRIANVIGQCSCVFQRFRRFICLSAISRLQQAASEAD
jgi:hypothetical protein